MQRFLNVYQIYTSGVLVIDSWRVGSRVEGKHAKAHGISKLGVDDYSGTEGHIGPNYIIQVMMPQKCVITSESELRTFFTKKCVSSMPISIQVFLMEMQLLVSVNLVL